MAGQETDKEGGVSESNFLCWNEPEDEEIEKQIIFAPGQIHQKNVFEFWKEELEASEWVLDTLKEGYKIPFAKIPERYEEKNNASALSNMKEVRAQVAEMIAMGVVRVVKE